MINKLVSSCLILAASSTCTAAHNPCQQVCKYATPQTTKQVIIVHSLRGIHANLTLCQRQKSTWQPVLNTPFHAVIGKHGIAEQGKKKEGDLKTPAGLFRLGTTFGTQPLAVKMDYKYITVDDKFIDDVHHAQYNTWVSGPTDAQSYESMRIPLYTYGAVINYNQNPIQPGKGSAIFLHIWRSPNSPTAGCVALAKENLLTLLHWLDKAKHPYILVY